METDNLFESQIEVLEAINETHSEMLSQLETANHNLATVIEEHRSDTWSNVSALQINDNIQEQNILENMLETRQNVSDLVQMANLFESQIEDLVEMDSSLEQQIEALED